MACVQRLADSNGDSSGAVQAPMSRTVTVYCGGVGVSDLGLSLN